MKHYKLIFLILCFVVTITLLCFMTTTDKETTEEFVSNNKCGFKVTKFGNSAKCVLQVGIRYPPSQVSREGWLRWCGKYGYDFVEVVDENYHDEDIGVAWWRIKAILALFKCDYNVIMHVDGDTVPLYLGVSMEDHMKKGRSTTLLWLSEDNLMRNRPIYNSINFGIFIIKKHPLTERILKECWKERLQRTVWPREQGAIEDWLANNIKTKEQWDEHFHISKYNTWQTFGMHVDDYNTSALSAFSHDPDFIIRTGGKDGAWVLHVLVRPHDVMMHIMKRVMETYDRVHVGQKSNGIEKLPTLGGVYITYKQSKAVDLAMENFRKHYPSSKVVICSDGGFYLKSLAKKYNAVYIHEKHLETSGILNYDNIDSCMMYCERLRRCINEIDNDYFMRLEDDVWVQQKTDLTKLEHEINGCNTTTSFPKGVYNLLDKYVGQGKYTLYYGGAGGAIYRTSFFKKIFSDLSRLRQDLMELTEVIQGCPDDMFMSYLCYKYGGTVGQFKGYAETWDTARVAQGNIEVLHKYKDWYETQKRGYFLIANGKKYVDMVKILVESINEHDNQKSICIWTDEPDYCQEKVGDRVDVLVYDVDDHKQMFNLPNLQPFEKLGCIPKILIPLVTPYEESIFIDTDSLVLGNTAKLWGVIEKMGYAFVMSIGVSDENNMGPSDWHFGKLENVSNKVGHAVPQISSTLLFIQKKQVPVDYSTMLQDLFNNHWKFGIERIYSGNSLPDEIFYAIFMGKYRIKPINNDDQRFVYISYNTNKDTINSARSNKYPIITYVDKNINTIT